MAVRSIWTRISGIFTALPTTDKAIVVPTASTNHGVAISAGDGSLNITTAGTSGQPLLAGNAADPAFGAMALASATAGVNNNVSGALPVENGGNGATIQTFNPATDVSGCKLWLKADAGLVTAVNNTAIGSPWSDQSGQGNHAVQATAGRQPLYMEFATPNNLPALKFVAASSNEMSLPGTLATYISNSDYTFFAVVSPLTFSGTVGNSPTVLGQATEYFGLHTNTGQKFEHLVFDSATRDALLYADVNPTLRWFAIQGRKTGGNHYIKTNYITEISIASSNVGLLTGALWLGSRNNLNFFNGYIAEILIYNVHVSDANKALIMAYLSNKYNLPIS